MCMMQHWSQTAHTGIGIELDRTRTHVAETLQKTKAALRGGLLLF